MAAVLQARLTEPVVRKVMLTAHRYTAPEALASGLVDEIVPADGSEAAISFAITKAMGMAPLAESGVSCAGPTHSGTLTARTRHTVTDTEWLLGLCHLQVLRAMKEVLYAPALTMLARHEPPSIGLPQKENAYAFKALLAAEVAAKL